MAGRLALALILAAVPLTAATQQPPQGFQRSYWSLIINEVPKGDTDALLRGVEVWIPLATLEKAGMKGFAGRRDTLMGKVHVLLGSLEPDVTTRLDLAQTVMYITAGPQFFDETRVVLQLDRPAGLVQARNTSLYLNYSATWDQTAGVSGYGDAGVSFRGHVSVGSDFSVESDGHVRRGLSVVTFDRPSARRRWQVGDVVPRSTPLGSAPILAGVFFARDYSIDPYYYRYPTPTFRGVVRAPSDADVYVNDVLVRRLQIAPGPYRLDRLPLTAGRGDVRIVLRDPFGRQQEIHSRVYLATGLLTKGEQDFEYAAGAIRDDAGDEPTYGDLAATLTHRIGLTNWLTMGASAEGTTGVVSAGPNLAVRFARLGEFEIHSSASTTSDHTSGYAVYGIYNFVGRWLNIDALAQYYDPGYANIWQKPGEFDTPEYYQASAGVPLFRIGSLTYTAEYERSPAGNWGLTQPDGSFDSQIVPAVSHSLRTTIRVFPRGQLSLNVTRTTVRGEEIWSGLAGLNISIGRHTIASATYSKQPQSEATYIDVNKSLPIGRGFGYRLSASDDAGGSAYGEFSVNTRYNQMRVTLDATEQGDQTTGSATMSGGMIVAGGGFFLTRPLDSSAAVVEVAGLRNVRILANNVEVARTGRGGRALVPRLLPYLANRISLNEADIPFDYTVPISSQLIAPPFRGAAAVKFFTTRIQARTGSVRLTVDGRDVVPSFGSIAVTLPQGPVESPLNADGEFFLDLPDGRHQATITFQGRSCRVDFDATARKGELIQRIGLLRCTP